MASSDHVNDDHPPQPPAFGNSNKTNIVPGKFEDALYFTCSLFDADKLKCLIRGAVLASCTPSLEQDMYGCSGTAEEKQITQASRDLIVPNKMTCSVCVADFSCRSDQIQHYKLDWHRFNLKEKLKGNVPISEADFYEQSGDISSLSGSDSESESKTSSDVSSSPRHKTRPSPVPDYLRTYNEQQSKLSENSSETDDTDDGSPKSCRMHPKVYFQNSDGRVVGLYRCVIHSKQSSPVSKEALIAMLNRVPEESNWAIILVGGGHFAAAIFECSTVLEHKTFHRYTVRAKQGGSQGGRDGRQGGQHFNSAGSSLRRYNESALLKDIQDLLSTWSIRLQACHRIFYRAPSFNRSILFGGKNPPFKRDDDRLRTIPFPTRRATYSEVQRVHTVLSTLECFGDSTSYKESLPVSPKVHLGTRKKKAASPSSETQTSKGSSKDSSVSMCLRTINTKEEENSHVAKSDENLASSPKDKLLPIVENHKDICLSVGADSVNKSLKEPDEIDLNVQQEKFALDDKEEMKVPAPPKRRRVRHKANVLFKRQEDPEVDKTAGEKYQVKNSLYDACKTGNISKVHKLLGVFASSKESSFMQPNPQNPSCSSMQSQATNGNGTSAEIISDFHVSCPKCSEASQANEDSSKNVNSLFNVPSRHASRSSSIFDSSNNVEVAVCNRRRHSSVECGNSSDILSLISNLDKCTLSNSSATHSRCSSLPSSPRSQHNKKQRRHSLSSDESMPIAISPAILNEKINDEGTTLLHVASKEGHHCVVKALLEYGADPTIRNRKGLTPYMVSSDKEMRNVYRRFMASHPECHDYNKAQIPSPLTEEQEADKLEKSKEKKKLKKAKMKERKIQAAELKKEEEEKHRFLALSDREKRALAAEKRYVKQLSSQPGETSSPVLSRCFSCGMDITGKTPFEYLDFVFCSITCLKKHRAMASSS